MGMEDPSMERLEQSLKDMEKTIALGSKIMTIVGVTNLVIALGCLVFLLSRISTPQYLNFQSLGEVRAQEEHVTAAIVEACLSGGNEWNQDYGPNKTGCSVPVDVDLSWYVIPILNPQYAKAQNDIMFSVIVGSLTFAVGLILIIDNYRSAAIKRQRAGRG